MFVQWIECYRIIRHVSNYTKKKCTKKKHWKWSKICERTGKNHWPLFGASDLCVVQGEMRCFCWNQVNAISKQAKCFVASNNTVNSSYYCFAMEIWEPNDNLNTPSAHFRLPKQQMLDASKTKNEIKREKNEEFCVSNSRRDALHLLWHLNPYFQNSVPWLQAIGFAGWFTSFWE